MGNLEATLKYLDGVGPSEDSLVSVGEAKEAFRTYDGEQEKPVPSARRVCVDYGNPGGDPEAKVTVDLHADGLIEVVDIEQFEPKPQYKLEAGCTVTWRHGACDQSWNSHDSWTVVYVMDTPSRKLVLCSDGAVRAASNLRVTKPATPEVGDYVEVDVRDGKHTFAAVIDAVRDGPDYVLSDGGYWPRENFTIIAKAK